MALQFFTRLPIPRWVGFEADWLHHASRYFPLVGIVVAGIAAAIYVACSLVFPPIVAVLLSTIAGIYKTGAFHEDGFADMCDGFGGGMTAERVLEIMKDSRIGAYGAIGIGLLLALKCAALSSLTTRSVVAALFIAHPLSRLAAVTLIWRLDYVRDVGKAKPLAERMTTAEYALAASVSLIPIVILLLIGWITWITLVTGIAAVMFATFYLSKLFVRRIGGYTGDCLGAVQQLGEVAFYLAVLASSAPHVLL